MEAEESLNRQAQAALRKTGIEPIGDAPSGTHFCHFYETQADLVDLLVPYFRAGLENNEFCMWITSEPLEVADAETALRKELPELDNYIKKGQIEILDYSDWYTEGGSFDADRVLEGWVEKEQSAIKRGFDGLRLTGNTFWLEKSDWRSFTDYEAKVNGVIGQYRMLALCSYALEKCGPHEFMDVIHNHQFALVRREGRWEVLASSALQQARLALQESEEHFRDLFNMMTEGFAVHELICDTDGKPFDYRFLEVNPAFERLTGLRAADIGGRTVREVLPGVESIWIERYGQVALTGEPQKFESYSQPLGRRYEVHAFRTQPMQFAVVFLDITERKRMEDALAEQRALLQSERDLLDTIMENTEAHLAYLDSGFNFVRVNSTYARGCDHSADELIGRNHFDLFPNEENRTIFEKVRDTGEPVRYIAKPFEFADQPERGVTYWDWTLIPIKDGSGQVQGLVLSLLDVTERKRIEETLREHREDLNRAQAVAHTGSWRLDVRRDELLWSDETYRMFGISRGTPLTYETFLETVHPEDREYVDQKWTAALGGEPYDIEHRIVVGDTIRWVRERAELEFDKQGTLLGGFGTVQDITERKQAEEHIRAQSAFLQRVLDSLSHPFYVVDANDHTIKLANTVTAAGPLSGSVPCYQLFHNLSEPCRGDESVCPLDVVKKTKTPMTVEHTHRNQDGTRRVVEVHCHPLLDDEGNVNQVIEYQIDVSERKRVEEALERLRSEFMGMVTHELKTPLTAIKGSAATALRSQRPLAEEDNRELFEIIDEQSDRLRELMDNLLDVTRIEAGTLSVSPEPTDLRAVLEEARATFVRGGGLHEVRLEFPTDMPQVSADRRRIFQVLMNLLNNAAMYSPSTEPITVAVEHDPVQITVHVRDRGQGIPREKLPLLFKKFSRLHDDAGRKLSGTGLGLAICKGIVEAHGGRIWADSAGEGKGSTFSFTLPVAGDTVKSLTDEARRAVHLGRVRRPSEKTRVLAVDDEPQVLRFLQRSLDEAGYQPIVTSDPSQVAKLVELEEPDLVLLDLGLPGTSGFELLQRIREFSGVPVIFVTASDEEADTVRALKMGADDYITKPFSPSELLARIGAALRRRMLPDVMEARPPFVLGDLTINFVKRQVSVAGRDVSLSATEYKILYELATHAGRPLTYAQILHQVWGPEYSGETELVRSFVSSLRRKLGDDARNPRFILTERQVGYRMPKP